MIDRNPFAVSTDKGVSRFVGRKVGSGAERKEKGYYIGNQFESDLRILHN